MGKTEEGGNKEEGKLEASVYVELYAAHYVKMHLTTVTYRLICPLSSVTPEPRRTIFESI